MERPNKDDWTNQRVRAQAGLQLVGLVLKFSGVLYEGYAVQKKKIPA